jgi:hypothetical protein
MPTNVGAFTVFGAIEGKWLSLGGVGGLLGAPLSNESPTFDGAGRAQTFRGGIVSWHPTIGAHEVHGAILARWLEVGREQFGHPITDESTCPDNVGKFNHFRALQFPGNPESSIYWTPTTGPHDIFGAIRDTWASMGFERSFLRYPMGSEHDLPGIRAQNFQGGVMTWTGSDGASAHAVSGNTVTFDSGRLNVPDPVALSGNVQLVFQRDGNFVFTTHAHDSGASSIDYGVVALLVTSSGRAFKFVRTGSISGSPFSGANDDPDPIKGQNPELAAAFDDIVASGRLLAQFTGTDKLLGAIEDLLADAAKQLAAAGVKALVTAIVA